MAETRTLFRYRCRCGADDFLLLDAAAARCVRCLAAYPRSPGGVIDFLHQKTEQNDYFDALYLAGHSHKRHEQSEERAPAYWENNQGSQSYLETCGFDFQESFENLSILEVACGSGRLTAELLQNPRIQNCTFHAFDASPHGPELLARFLPNIRTSNRLEMSVQDAEAMIFADAAFEVVLGRSVLHHFGDLEGFLRDCRRILKPGGVATFGEPFALGYGLAAAVLRMAQRQVGRDHPALEDFCHDVAYRIKSGREQLKPLVDKHLFFPSTFQGVARQAGFSSVEFASLYPYEYYRDEFIDDLLAERQISDAILADAARKMYREIVDIFAADTLVHSIGAFVQIVMRT